jgi:RNA polymerase-interacting CarD/CdnL/TRCF family regulator
MTNTASTALVVCTENDGYGVSLERRKIYVSIPDREAEKQGLRRVVDESGEDYLYPADFFRPIELPQPVKRAVLAA